MTRDKASRKVYAVLPGEPVNDHWHGVQFLTETALAAYRQGGPAEDAKAVLLTDPDLKDKVLLRDYSKDADNPRTVIEAEAAASDRSARRSLTVTW